MAISIIGTPDAVAGTSIALPTHAIGDIILLFIYRDGSTSTATLPAASGTVPAWSNINNVVGANLNSARSAYFVATADNHTSGTWTNATGMATIVLRGQAAAPIGASIQSGGGAGSNQVVASAITPQVTDGSSAFILFYGHRTVTSWSSAPAGYTRRAAIATEVCVNTKDDTTSDGSISQPCSASSSGYRGEQIEIKAFVSSGASQISPLLMFG